MRSLYRKEGEDYRVACKLADAEFRAIRECLRTSGVVKNKLKRLPDHVTQGSRMAITEGGKTSSDVPLFCVIGGLSRFSIKGISPEKQHCPYHIILLISHLLLSWLDDDVLMMPVYNYFLFVI
jgi:hypothetical protein